MDEEELNYLENLIPRLKSNKFSLPELNLSYKILNKEYFISLCDALAYNTQLNEINLVDSELPDGSGNLLLELLDKNTTIRKINLRNTMNVSNEEKEKINKKLLENVISIISNHNGYLLSELDLSDKVIDKEFLNKLCEVLENNSNITRINFNNCELPENSCDKIIYLLEHNKMIIEITMNNATNLSKEEKCKIKDKLFNNYLDDILSLITANQPITYFSLAQKYLDEDYFTKLCNALKINTKINEINFEFTEFPNGSCKKLLDMLDHNKVIREINMTNAINLSETEKKEIHKKLFDNLLYRIGNNVSKPTLYVNNGKINQENFNKLCEVLKTNSITKEVILDNSVLPENACEKLLDMLNYNKTIKDIYMHKTTNLSEQDKKKIRKKLSDNFVVNLLPFIISNDKSYSSLSFSYKIFDEDLLNKLCEALKNNSIITDIYLNHSLLPVGSCEKLMKLLDSNNTLRDIYMNNTLNLSEEDKKNIKIKLSNNYLNQIFPLIDSNDDTLTTLDLSNLQIEEESLNKLCESLKNNSTISEIYFINTELPNESSKKLINLLDSNKNIKNINLYNTLNLSEEDKNKIKDKIIN